MTLSLVLLVATLAVPPRVDAAIAAAAPGLRTEVIDWRAALVDGCRAERFEVLRPVAASGSVPLRVEGSDGRGAPCEGWGWARVRAFGRGLVAARAIRAGEPLAGAVAPAEAEVAPGRPALSALPEGAVATRAIPAGGRVDADVVRTGPPPGTPVTVLVRAGALAVERPGRAVPCSRDHACALLPSGRRVEGRFVDGLVVVEVP